MKFMVSSWKKHEIHGFHSDKTRGIHEIHGFHPEKRWKIH